MSNIMWVRRLTLFLLMSTTAAGETKCKPPPDVSKGLTPELRSRFYSLHEGSDMLPLSWLQNLPVWDGFRRVLGEQSKQQLLFLDPENLRRYGLIPFPTELGTSLSGAIGLSVDPKTKMVGVNCAACHVNQIKVNGVDYLLDGAPNMFDTEKFAKEMYESLFRISLSPTRWTKFAAAVIKSGGTIPLDVVFQKTPYLLQLFLLAGNQRLHPYNAGPGRIDDFGGARNVLWPESPVELVGASSILDLWSFQNATWIHWDLNMNSKFDRNLGQALTGGALYGGDQFRGTGTIDRGKVGKITAAPCNIAELESIAELMKAPKWPGEIEASLASAGKDLFQQHCAHCHTDNLSPKTVPVDKVGTDPHRARTYLSPMQDGSPFLTTANRELPRLKRQIFLKLGFHPAANGVVENVDPLGDGAAWQKTDGYVPRPLKGIWASAPYLHNGSVLTLTQVLNSGSRKDSFQMTGLEYDSINVGYKHKNCAGLDENPEEYCFDTKLPGNSKEGHTYGDSLSEQERKAVIEYLKTRE